MHCRPDWLSGIRDCYSWHTRPTPEPGTLVHAIVHVQDELRGCARDAFAMRHVIERTLQFGMLANILANFVQALAGGFQALLELGFGLHFGLAESHLYAAVRVHLAFS